MDHDEHLRLLGEVTGRSQQLELCTAQLLARVLVVSDSTARLLASKMGQVAILHVLAELAERGESGHLEPEALTRWVAVAQRANKARNHVVLSPWIFDESTEAVSVLVNGSMKDAPRSEVELRQDVDCLTNAVVGAINLL